MFSSTKAEHLFEMQPFITWLNIAIPVGSTIILSGLKDFNISIIASSKLPDKSQQMQPKVISFTSTPLFFNNYPSIIISQNSFSRTTTLRLVNAVEEHEKQEYFICLIHP